MPLISVIAPCYNEEPAIPAFYSEITKVADSMKSKHGVDFEIIFVNDGSADGSLDIMRSLAKKDRRVRYISFSRNFGKEAGIFAGLSASKGDFTAIMDADLQDPPYLLEEMYTGITEEGYDCVAARRVSRKGEPPIRSFFARRFYSLMRKTSKIEIADGARDFRLMTRKMTDAVLSLSERNRFSKGIFGWVGFDTKWVEYENIERVAGETKWSFWQLVAYSVEGICSFSTFLLSLATWVGIFFCFAAFLFIAFILIRSLFWQDPVSGWSSTMCVMLLLGGLQLFCTGVLGKYLSKTYIETKNRPLYVVKETEEDIII
ncbi:MAG: glycosyltransferase family 2 protein [Clostridia bacterium]|nr:glycosyltransferase family 2 protein [Clostridia bacterium]